MNEIIIDYKQASPLTGIANASYTDVPGTIIKLQPGTYNLISVAGLRIVRSAVDGTSSQCRYQLLVDGSTFQESVHFLTTAGAQQYYYVRHCIAVTIKLISAVLIRMQAYIDANGTVASRDVNEVSLIITKT